MGRRAALAGGAVLAAGALATYAGWVEPRRLVVRRSELAPAGWPAGLDGLRVALLSDLHSGAPHVKRDRVGKVVDRLRAEAPDLALLLGDFVDPAVALASAVHPEEIAPPLATAGARLGTFAVLGNHDWHHGGERMRDALLAAGIPVLENDALPVAGAPEPLWVAGVADERERLADVAAALLPVPAGAAVLLLSHDPDVFPRVPPRVALTVSGHTHGGQVNIPLLRRAVIPSRYGERYSDGHVVEGGRHLYVTAGVGTSGLPLRFLRPPEIVVLTLRSG
ncbi:MAG TPA: metallophosphoesterase [Solirubrobacteraceae bacterium]|nr:metallophosphoesterase [Solirubrobacteraceae bacterium]